MHAYCVLLYLTAALYIVFEYYSVVLTVLLG